MLPSRLAKKMARIFLEHSKSREDALLIVEEIINLSGLTGNFKIALGDVKPFLCKEGKSNGRESGCPEGTFGVKENIPST